MSDITVHNSHAGFGVIRAARTGRYERDLSDRKVVEAIWAKADKEARNSPNTQVIKHK
ncbi:hypothetical protein [Antiquaquibacter soli]|uniref:Uncharacterized protein n=1 Tax=Antiquaquibacter soli TaxID=3064523 RepID=A0ABT9BSK6_9MICO|nr:hypothetical protein [Protaetiibacter sp. WY-16]MDO7882327.1 hypothetical protein [Protaetiibacter sp. WY-16]